MILDQGGNYEKPDSNTYVGVIVDIVDLLNIQTTYGVKNKVRIIWLLDKNDSTGKPYRVMRQVNATLTERSDLYKIATQILGQAPPIRGFDTESLIGRANLLFVQKTKAPNEKEYANVMGIMPLPAGAAIPKVPADFVRAKDRKPFVPNQPGQGQAPAQAAPAQPQPVATTAGVGPVPGTPQPQTSNVQF